MGFFVNSFRNVMSYGFGANQTLVSNCVNNGFGNKAQCTALAERVGTVACADLGMRGVVGTLGVFHGVQGVNLFTQGTKDLVTAARENRALGRIVPEDETEKQRQVKEGKTRVFQLIKTGCFRLVRSAMYLTVSAVEMSVAFFLPVMTLGGNGKLTMDGVPNFSRA